MFEKQMISEGVAGEKGSTSEPPPFCLTIPWVLGILSYKMPSATASIRIRPIRFGFVVDPQDQAALLEVFRVNTVLWGGPYNFIIPLFRKTPTRYRERFLRAPSATELVNGLIEAFQPDLIVEVKAGLTNSVAFPRERTISIEELKTRDDQGRCRYGIDIRSVCADLYDETFRFVQRHPPKVIIPHSADKRFELLFAAVFGDFPTSGSLTDCVEHFKGALDAKAETLEPLDFTRLFKREYLYPLRVVNHELTTFQSGWRPDPMLFYMDERSSYDLIEFWNYRAIGWRIKPLPATLAGSMKEYCEQFIIDSHKPFPPPSNAYEHASFLCSRSCNWEAMQSFVSGLNRQSDDLISIDPRVPRLWEEWGRNADHADPQEVTHATESPEATLSGDSLHLRTVVPEFLSASPCAAPEHACVNVVESVPGGAAVIPWQGVKLNALTGQFADERTWLGREGIVTTAGEHSHYRFLRSPNPINVFSAFAEAHNFSFSLSPAGQTCEQVISALGGLQWIRLIADEGILKLLDRLADGSLEIDVPDDEANTKRRVRMESAPYSFVQEVLMRAINRPSDAKADIAARRLNALVRFNVLKLGMRLKCAECSQRSWYGLNDLAPVLKCPRCMRQFELLVDRPPRDEWAYRVFGPFAVENYAAGSYCAAMALQFLAEEVAAASTWVPSFQMSRADMACEADFGMFLRPTPFSHAKGPFLVFGECKTFGDFQEKDFRRARDLAKLFPGAVLCFATLKEALSRAEKQEISRIAQRGRSRLKTGQQTSPVIVLTRLELFGQFKIGKFSQDYGARAEQGRHIFLTRNLDEVADFTQQVHLGMQSYHSWLEAKRQKRAAKLSKSATA